MLLPQRTSQSNRLFIRENQIESLLDCNYKCKNWLELANIDHV